MTNLQASLVLPMELADLTVFLPGPSAILGILISALDSTAGGRTEFTIAAAVNAMAHVMTGHNNVAVYDGSLYEWLGEGLPVNGTGKWEVWKKQ